MNEQIISIPARLKNMTVAGHVAGAIDILDDDLLLTLAQINAIVLGDAVNVNLTTNPSIIFVDWNPDILLTATTSTAADIIKISKKQNDLFSIISEGSGQSLVYRDHHTSTGTTNVIEYKADFVVGGLTKTVTRNVTVVYPIYYGYGNKSTYDENVHTDRVLSPKTSPAGTYTIDVPSNSLYVWFIVPNTMNVNKATMSGFDFPLESPTNEDISGVTYKVYRSSNTYDAGQLIIVIS